MTACNLLGWCASALLLSASLCRREAAMRCLGIAANLSFIVYAAEIGITSVVVVQSALLVINSARLALLLRKRRAGRSSPLPAKDSPGPLLPRNAK